MAKILEEQIDGVRYWRFKVFSCSTVCWKGWASGLVQIYCCLIRQYPEVRWMYTKRQA